MKSYVITYWLSMARLCMIIFQMKSVDQVTRTKEGLYCHHLREDRGGNLSSPGAADSQPFEWQKKENLLYCNILEHLILHIKIAVLRDKRIFKEAANIESFFTTHGINMICKDIVDFFELDGTKVAWKKRCFEEVRDNYDDFLDIINSIFLYIDARYIGPKSDDVLLEKGRKFLWGDTETEIVDVSSDKSLVKVILDNSREKIFYTSLYWSKMSYDEIRDSLLRSLCVGYDKFYSDIYNDLVKREMGKAYEYTDLWSIDFKGYGFPQFNKDLILFEEYGAHCVDEYLYKAMPSAFGKPENEVIKDAPIFWKGGIPTEIKGKDKINYIVRARAAFCIKDGKEPFYRYKGFDYGPSEKGLDDDNNLAFRNGKVIKDSFHYKYKEDKWYSHYLDKDGKERMTLLTISIAKADIPMFFDVYDVNEFIVLDGCYWEK